MTEPFTLLGGRLRLARGAHNPAEDALWLAASITPAPGARVLDAMCGNGVVGLALLTRLPEHDLDVTGVDSDATMVGEANANAAMNDLDDHYQAMWGDVTALPAALYDVILCNPPYHAQARGHQSPDARKTKAHSLPDKALTHWLEALVRQLAPEGTLTLILHSACETEVTAFAQRAAFKVTLTPLATSPDRPAKRLLAMLQAGDFEVVTHQPIKAHDGALRKDVLEQGLRLFP